MDIITKVNSIVYSIVGGIPMIVVLLATGIFCTFLLKGIQFRKFGLAVKTVFKTDKNEKSDKTLTPFQALCTALASTVGTGNIAGVAGAIALGGPGAVFWMWIAALFGMATKFSEIVLAIHYREKNASGEWAGGPMYYIKNGLGKNWKWLAYIFAACCAISAFGIGNMTQINTITATISSVAEHFSPSVVEYEFYLKLGIGILVAISAALVFFGGIGRIGKITEKLTPVMSLLYVGGALIIIFANINSIGNVFGLIVKSAFNSSAVLGGAAGITMKKTMEMGIGRGIFSNEAGLGSAPIAHATSNTDSAVKQGFLGIFEVFVTIIICSITALAILGSGIEIEYGTTAGAELTTAAFATVIGDGAARIFMALAIGLFALSTIYGWVIYGVRSIEFLFGHKAVKYYYIADLAVIVIGAVSRIDIVWAISDTLNCTMAIPNLVAVLALSTVVAKLTKEHFAKK